jgi:glyoxalase family protein
MTTRSLLGVHHITAITGDAARNVDFYARVLGLRLVKKTVNYDAPDVYHLYFGAETGEPGSVLTFFEFPAAPRGAAGAGMIHRISFDVASQAALAYWKARLADAGVATSQGQGFLRFRDPEDLELELMVDEYAPSEFAAVAPDIPPENRLRGFSGVSAYSALPAASQPLLSVLGFARQSGDAYVIGSANRIASYAYSPPADVQPMQGAGTVHHIAWACPDQDQPDWRRALVEAGAHVTPIIDRTYFHSIYFREPSGVLFEIATLGPGFAVDEPPDSLGETLTLPVHYEWMRAELEGRLTPIENPRHVRTV